MDEQNSQISQEKQFLFSLIHANTKYDFISFWKISHTAIGSLYLCQIYPLNINCQIIRIDTHSLKIQLNRLLLQSNAYISSAGFKFKLHPIKGIFFLQCSYLSCLQINSFLTIKQRIQTFQDQIIFKLNNSQAIKTIIDKILTFKENGSIFSNKKNYFSQILRFTYNSTFYGWISPKDEKSTELKGDDECKTNRKDEIWSDCSQDEEEKQLSNKQNQTNESFTDNISPRERLKQPIFSDFYNHYRFEYDKISPFGQNEIRSHKMFEEEIYQDSDLVVKYFMSKQDDVEVYEKYLLKYVQTVNQWQETQKIERVKQNEKKKQTLEFYNKFHEQTIDKTTQTSNLVNFIEFNQLTLSKSSKWMVLVNIISKVYQDFINSKVKEKNDYLDMKNYHIKKTLQANLNQKNQQIVYLFIPAIKKAQLQQTQFMQQPQLQNKFKNIQLFQQNVAQILLNIVCFICVPDVKLINRRFNKTEELLINAKHKIMQRQLSMEGQYSKFKSTNFEIESILLYLHQKAMKFNEAPFADWVMIMCEHINEVFQEGMVLLS